VFPVSMVAVVACDFRAAQGFIKLAMELGTPLVPGFSFGNTACMRVVADPVGICARVSRWARVSLLLIFGRFGLPFPCKVPVVTVIGKPIQVQQTANPSDEVYSVAPYVVVYADRPLSCPGCG
jgi:diacylglycerol O-acyltransferase 2, plant